jgi:diacylglycerol O-acyltransferase
VRQLTGLDGAFLAMETHAVFGHVGSICIVDPMTSENTLTLKRLSKVVEARLHLVAPFHRRLAHPPLGPDQPYWIKDPDFDLE